jgi:hypothetical protein
MLILSDIIEKAIKQGKTSQDILKIIEDQKAIDAQQAKEYEQAELVETIRDNDFISYLEGDSLLTDEEVLDIVIDTTKKLLKEYR